MYCWEAAKRSQAAITESLLFRKSTGVIPRDALPALQRLCANGPFEDCQVRMFVKQRALSSANVCEAGLIAKSECLWSSRTGGSNSYLLLINKIILQQLKPSTLDMMFQLTLIFYPHHTGMRSEMLYFTLTGHLKSAKNEFLWSSVEKTAEAFTCCRKKYLCSSKNSQISTWYVLTP